MVDPSHQMADNFQNLRQYFDFGRWEFDVGIVCFGNMLEWNGMNCRNISMCSQTLEHRQDPKLLGPWLS